MKSFIFAVLFFTLVAAQRYTYTTSVVTECFSSTPTNFAIPAATPVQGSDGYYTIDMPECRNCDCPDCTYTNTYSSTYDVFAPTGTVASTYSVKEVYRGMNTTAAYPSGTPYGFTTNVKTCTACGDEPVTATLTYPRGAVPYIASMTGIPTAADPDPGTLAPAAGVTGTIAVNSGSGRNGGSGPQVTGTPVDKPASTDKPGVITGDANVSIQPLRGAWLALILPIIIMMF